jgi:hypothetical protein
MKMKLSTSKKCFIVNKLTEEGDLKGLKMASTRLGSLCEEKYYLFQFFLLDK